MKKTDNADGQENVKSLKHKGVTLLELIAVIGIVGIIAGLSFSHYLERAKQDHRKQAKQFLQILLNAARVFDSGHPEQIVGVRTPEDWELHWKSYLDEYTAKQPDFTPALLNLTTGSGNKTTKYFFEEEPPGSLRIVALYADDLSYDYITWDGALNGFTPPSGGTCASATACNDGSKCTDDQCVGGSCLNPPITCDDGKPCTEDSCVPAVGCQFTPLPGTPCDDGAFCTQNDICASGMCEGDPVLCDDGDACNGVETCNPADGSCLLGTPLNCDDGNVCTLDSCNPAAGCEHANEPPAKSCDDGNLCTSGDHCNGSGSCIGGLGKFCPVPLPANPCKVSTCNPATGACKLQNKPNGTACDNKTGCATGDKCQNGICVDPSLCLTPGGASP